MIEEKPKEELIDNNTFEDLEKLKEDIKHLNVFYEQQNKKIKEEKKISIEDSTEKEKPTRIEYDSKTLKQPIIKKSNFEHYLRSELSKKDLSKINLSIINYPSLKEIINYCGSYPEKSRKLIWKYLLSLPNDRNLFYIYSNKGIHPFYQLIEEVFPIADQKYLRRVQVICSLISFWCPHIGNVYYLPNIVFPFIKSIQGDDIFVFETLIALFNSVCRYWFEMYPNMPLTHVNYVNDIIKTETKNVLENIMNTLHISMNEIIWRLLSNFFSESFAKNDWLSFVDFIITYNHKPEMILYFSAAFIISNKDDIVKYKNNMKKIASILFEIETKRDVLSLIKSTLKLYSKYNKKQTFVYKAYVPFPDNEYPVMDKFPLDFLKTTQQLKEDLVSGKLDVNEEIDFCDKNKKILDDKYKELQRREHEIEYCYQGLLETQKEKNSILKRELDMILHQKQKIFDEIKKIK